MPGTSEVRERTHKCMHTLPNTDGLSYAGHTVSDRLDLEVQANQGEDHTLDILDEIVERSKALWVSACGRQITKKEHTKLPATKKVQRNMMSFSKRANVDILNNEVAGRSSRGLGVPLWTEWFSCE